MLPSDSLPIMGSGSVALRAGELASARETAETFRRDAENAARITEAAVALGVGLDVLGSR